MPHKELTFFALSVSQVTGCLNALTTISNSLRHQALYNSFRVGGCFLSVFTLRRDSRGIFSNFMLRLLCPVNPLGCNHPRTIRTLDPASACTMPAASPTALLSICPQSPVHWKSHTDGLLHVLSAKCSQPPGVHCHKHSWEWSQYVRSYCSPLRNGASSAMQTICHSIH